MTARPCKAFAVLALVCGAAIAFGPASATANALDRVLQHRAGLGGAGHFAVLPLGMTGGTDEGDLTSFALIHSKSPKQAFMLDGGTVVHSLLKFQDVLGPFVDPVATYNNAFAFLRNHVKGYAITHPHYDHISGMVTTADDAVETGKPKHVYGLKFTTDTLQKNVFNDVAWPMYQGKGGEPLKFAFHEMTHASKVDIVGMPKWTIQSFELKHGFIASTAFLIQVGELSALFFGDVGPDHLVKETDHKIEDVWKAVAGLVVKKGLSGIMIELAYNNDRPEGQLFGHLTPKHLANELEKLAKLVASQSEVPDPSSAGGLNKKAKVLKEGKEPKNLPPLHGLNVVIIHVKTTTKPGYDPRATVAQQLCAEVSSNDRPLLHGINVLLPTQGQPFELHHMLESNKKQPAVQC